MSLKLPQSLLDQIGASGNSFHQIQKHRKPSRKDSRRLDRAAQKQRRFSVSKAPAGIQDDSDGIPNRKKARTTKPESLVLNASMGARHSTSHRLPARLKAKERADGGPSAKIRKVQVPPFRSQDTDEDRYIAFLENQLGYEKGVKRKKEEDGLDDLLDFASNILNAEDEKLQVDSEKDESDSNDDNESESSGGSEEWGGIEKEVDERLQTPPKAVNGVKKYVPPQARVLGEKDEENSEAFVKLKRQLNGCLNRLSEQNIESILDDVEKLFLKHRRHDATTAITSLVIEGVSSHSSLLDSFVVLYAAFIAGLHRILGPEFVAYFVQNVVSSYERYLSSAYANSSEETGKECSNLIVLISELYNFQITSCILVYDIIRDLLSGSLAEFQVELLLKIVRSSGQQLRQDDPSALKDIIQLVQGKISNTAEISSRTRFMVETLTNLKNNKLKRNTTQNQGGEAVERMKKFLSGLEKKRHVMAHEPLRISLEDLRSAETKGKWWLVGTAWGGDPLVDRLSMQKLDTTAEQRRENALLNLARSQGMNTDIRRSIFVVLMSSDDYVDACERLSQLNLSEIQQREIVRVNLHCCGNEKSYNPFYTLVCQHLCQSSASYKFTLQFCLWDFLRDLGETSVGGTEVVKNLEDAETLEVKKVSRSRIRNVAKAYAWWIAKDCCSLAILKPVDFTLLKPQSRAFLKEMILHIFVFSQTSSPLAGSDADISRDRALLESVFTKATQIPTLSAGLVWFLTDVFDFEGDTDTSLPQWGARVACEALQIETE